MPDPTSDDGMTDDEAAEAFMAALDDLNRNPWQEVADALADAFKKHGMTVETQTALVAGESPIYVNVPKSVVDAALTKYDALKGKGADD